LHSGLVLSIESKFLTGRAAHNTNVTTLSPPFGGWSKFVQEGLNDDWLPVWIHNAGIKTYYAGKLSNGYGKGNFDKPHPKGWTDSSFLVDPWTYNYMQSHWTNGQTNELKKYPGVHTTVVNAQKGLAWLEELGKSKEQFFMMLAPVAPHLQLSSGTGAPPPPPSQKGKFLGQKAPRRPNFNPDKPSGASWVRGLPKLKAKDIADGDKVHVGRVQNLAGIDNMVGNIIDKLKEHNILDNTYIIYTSDNGFHIGNHRLKPGKRCPYEEDINIPLLIRGPDVAQNVVSTVANHHTDMAPTILQMLGVPLRGNFDGAPIAYTKNDFSDQRKNEHVQIEFWDGGFGPNGYRGEDDAQFYYNNTYKAIRIWDESEDLSVLYSVWCEGTREFYDMKVSNRRSENSPQAHRSC
jgi:N-acetylglucosamine-6-sulfatase